MHLQTVFTTVFKTLKNGNPSFKTYPYTLHIKPQLTLITLLGLPPLLFPPPFPPPPPP